jgi:serine/threonine-protein kinase
MSGKVAALRPMRDSPFQPGDIVDRYRIVRPLGSGGTASVYEAIQVFLERRVALKILQVRHAQREDVKRRMRAEAIVLSRIRHPNVVAVQDAGMTDDGLVFIAMDLLEGQTLREVLHAYRYLSVPEALQFAVQIADGVQAAHELSVIHRDLKPENVFIQRDNQIKVLDLGTAKFFGHHLETTGKMRWVGTPAYMSPEHLQGLGVTAQSDVYSLGLVIYEALAGHHPFVPSPHNVPTLHEIGWMQIYADPPALTTIVQGMPEGVWRVIRRAISKKPSERHSSMHELALELRRANHDFVQSCRERGLAPARRQVTPLPGEGGSHEPADANAGLQRTTERMDAGALFDTVRVPPSSGDPSADALGPGGTLRIGRSSNAPLPPAHTQTEPLARSAVRPFEMSQAPPPPLFDMSQGQRGARSSDPPALSPNAGADNVPTRTRAPVAAAGNPASGAEDGRARPPERATPALGWATLLDGWLPAQRSALLLTAVGFGICAAIPIGLIAAGFMRSRSADNPAETSARQPQPAAQPPTPSASSPTAPPLVLPGTDTRPLPSADADAGREPPSTSGPSPASTTSANAPPIRKKNAPATSNGAPTRRNNGSADAAPSADGPPLNLPGSGL